MSLAPRTNPALQTGNLKQVTLTQANLGGDDGRARTEPPPPDATPNPYIGATVDGRYFVEAQLGEGGMGIVYRCRHTIIDKMVAMKVLRADLARNEEVTERFLNEARSASSIGNPHIIDISDFGRLPDGATYFIMEFLSGTPLADLVETRVALEPARAAHIVLQLTEGLAAAHEAGIIHRDLKPDNIFLVKRGSQEDFVKILDFGIAKASTSSAKLTQAGQVFGTPHYMSPEQAAGSEVDSRSDIYAVGVILYELCTGRLPFDADNFMAILTQHMYKAPTRPSLINGMKNPLPPGLEDVILKCMAKEPGERYQTMSALGEDIKHVFAGSLPSASREMRSMTENFGASSEFYDAVSRRPQPSTAETKSRGGLYATLGVVAALLAGGALWLSAKKEAAAPAPVAETPPTPVETPTPAVAPAAPKMRAVAVAVSPLAAHVFEGEKDLGQSPVMVEVGEKPLILTVKLDGYEAEELTVDGKETTVSVELTKLAGPKPVSRPTVNNQPASAPKAKPAGGGDLVDPWD